MFCTVDEKINDLVIFVIVDDNDVDDTLQYVRICKESARENYNHPKNKELKVIRKFNRFVPRSKRNRMISNTYANTVMMRSREVMIEWLSCRALV